MLGEQGRADEAFMGTVPPPAIHQHPSISPPPPPLLHTHTAVGDAATAADAPHFLAAAIDDPVVAVKGQLVAQQVEQARLGRVVLRPPPAGRQAGRQAKRQAHSTGCITAGTCTCACAPYPTSTALPARRARHGRAPRLRAHLSLSSRGPPQASAPPLARSHRMTSRQARSLTAPWGRVERGARGMAWARGGAEALHCHPEEKPLMSSHPPTHPPALCMATTAGMSSSRGVQPLRFIALKNICSEG